MVFILDLDECRHVDLAVLHLRGHDIPQANDGLSAGSFDIVKLDALFIFSEKLSVADMEIEAGHPA